MFVGPLIAGAAPESYLSKGWNLLLSCLLLYSHTPNPAQWLQPQVLALICCIIGMQSAWFRQAGACRILFTIDRRQWRDWVNLDWLSPYWLVGPLCWAAQQKSMPRNKAAEACEVFLRCHKPAQMSQCSSCAANLSVWAMPCMWQ